MATKCSGEEQLSNYLYQPLGQEGGWSSDVFVGYVGSIVGSIVGKYTKMDQALKGIADKHGLTFSKIAISPSEIETNDPR